MVLHGRPDNTWLGKMEGSPVHLEQIDTAAKQPKIKEKCKQ